MMQKRGIKRARMYLLLWPVLVLAGCATNNKAPTVEIPEKPPVNHEKAAKINAELSITYTQRGMLDRAKEKLLKAESQDDGIAEVYYAKGYYYQNLGMPDIAQSAYQKGLRVAPSDFKSYNFYAQFLCQDKDDYAQASQLFQKSISLPDNTNLAQTFTLYGQCLLKAGEIANAQDAFIQATKQGAGSSEAYWELANIYYQRQQNELALAAVNKYLGLVGKNTNALRLKMNTLQRLGQDNKAATIRLQLSSKLYEEDGFL